MKRELNIQKFKLIIYVLGVSFLLIWGCGGGQSEEEARAAYERMIAEDMKMMEEMFKPDPEEMKGVEDLKQLLPPEVFVEICAFDSAVYSSGRCRFSWSKSGKFLEAVSGVIKASDENQAPYLSISGIYAGLDLKKEVATQNRVRSYKIDQGKYKNEEDFQEVEGLGLHAVYFKEEWESMGGSRHDKLFVMGETHYWEFDYYTPKGSSDTTCSELSQLTRIFEVADQNIRPIMEAAAKDKSKEEL